MASGPVMLFDGECVLFNRTVWFVLDNERSNVLKFSTLQSKIGQEYLTRFGIPENKFESFVVVEGDKSYIKSAGIARLTYHMGGYWKTLSRVFSFVPRGFGDAIYSHVNRNRIRWFGKIESCNLPEESIKHRFITT